MNPIVNGCLLFATECFLCTDEQLNSVYGDGNNVWLAHCRQDSHLRCMLFKGRLTRLSRVSMFAGHLGRRKDLRLQELRRKKW